MSRLLTQFMVFGARTWLQHFCEEFERRTELPTSDALGKTGRHSQGVESRGVL